MKRLCGNTVGSQRGHFKPYERGHVHHAYLFRIIMILLKRLYQVRYYLCNVTLCAFVKNAEYVAFYNNPNKLRMIWNVKLNTAFNIMNCIRILYSILNALSSLQIQEYSIPILRVWLLWQDLYYFRVIF